MNYIWNQVKGEEVICEDRYNNNNNKIYNKYSSKLDMESSKRRTSNL